MSKKAILFWVCILVILIFAFNKGTSESAEPQKLDYEPMLFVNYDPEAQYLLTDEEVKLVALVTLAEAEGECEMGKRLVIDTVLNRVDHERFPDTVEDVIYQHAQFTSMWNGRVDKCRDKVDDYICRLVEEEVNNRTNRDCIFFTAGDYGKYGTPIFSIGNHYFSSYN